MIEKELTRSVIGAFFEVYNALGYGFLEHLYATAMECELLALGHRVAREISVPVMYKGEHLGRQRLDMIVDDKLIVEIKSTYQLPSVALRQLYSYLSATNLEVGLLLHFGPEPKFYRQVAHKIQRLLSVSDPLHPPNPNPNFMESPEAVEP